MPLGKLRSLVKDLREWGPSQVYVEREIECGLIVIWGNITESGERQGWKNNLEPKHVKSIFMHKRSECQD